MKTPEQIIKNDVRIFLSVVIILVTIGCVFIYSSSSIFALERCGTAHYFVIRQLLGVLIGLIGIAAIQFFTAQQIKRASPFLFFGTLFLTALTLVPLFARTVHGANRWINLGGVIFQPSELLKCTIILYISYLLTKKDWLTSLNLRDYVAPLVVWGISCAIVLKQPDFGLAVTITLAVLSLFFINHMRIKHLLVCLMALVPAGIVLIFLKAYRLRRILIFLNPWNDPRGSGFQIIQSLIAIGSGGWFGMGIGHSKQKFFYLPMQHTDFIFSVIAEETGFIGSAMVVFLYMVFLYFGIRIAMHVQNTYATLVISGITILISFQAIINMAVVSGLMPTKGIGLPFISYGNSSLACNLIMIGIILNCIRDYGYTKVSE